MFILCLTLWFVLNGRITWEILAFGVAVAAGVTLAARRLTGFTREKERKLFRKIPQILRYLCFLTAEIFRANRTVIRMVYSRKKPDPCYATFTAPLETAAARTALADSITLTPGTITAEMEENRYTVHCLDRSLAAGLEESGFVARLRKMENQEGKA